MCRYAFPAVWRVPHIPLPGTPREARPCLVLPVSKEAAARLQSVVADLPINHSSDHAVRATLGRQGRPRRPGLRVGRSHGDQRQRQDQQSGAAAAVSDLRERGACLAALPAPRWPPAARSRSRTRARWRSRFPSIRPRHGSGAWHLEGARLRARSVAWPRVVGPSPARERARFPDPSRARAR
jgi:hypothetical protein